MLQDLQTYFDLPILLRFGSVPPEAILYCSECTLNDEVQGSVFLTQNYVCFKSSRSKVAALLNSKLYKVALKLGQIHAVCTTIVPPLIEILQVFTAKNTYPLRYVSCIRDCADLC